MPKFPLIGPSYTSQSVNADCQVTMNLYPEAVESRAGNNHVVLYPAPGTKEFVDLTPVIPPPPVFLQPEVIQSGSYNWDLAGGITVGNSRQNIPIPGPAIEIGDTYFIFFAATIGPALPFNPILSVTSPLMLVGNWQQLGPAFDIGSIGGGNTGCWQCFYAKATIPVAPGALQINCFFGHPLSFDMAGSIMQIRNLDALSQETDVMSVAGAVSAPSITTLQPSFFISCFGSRASLTTPDLGIYFVLANGITFLAQVVAFFTVDPMLGNQFTAPPGLYSPAWTQTPGINAACINASFSIREA